MPKDNNSFSGNFIYSPTDKLVSNKGKEGTLFDDDAFRKLVGGLREDVKITKNELKDIRADRDKLYINIIEILSIFTVVISLVFYSISSVGDRPFLEVAGIIFLTFFCSLVMIITIHYLINAKRS